MEWMAALQSAIDYVEAHLTEPLDYGEIAKQAYSSSFHFQRVFGLICGYTLGEYIRGRRLTLAGAELVCTKCKVIDAALKYGYDSPESFGRAFTKFHGVTPSQAKAGARLRSFSRLSVKLILEGGTLMDYRIEKTGPVRMAVKQERFPRGEINHPQIKAFWERCREDGTMEALCGALKPEPFGKAVLGISFDRPDQGDFDYAVGVACGEGPVPDGLSQMELAGGTWAAFPCAGPMPDAFQTLWKRIYTEFFSTSEYQPSGGMGLEVYPGDDIGSADYTCEIWISVERRDRAAR